MQKFPARRRAIVDAIKSARLKRGVSQRELSRRLGQDSTFIHTIEHHRRNLQTDEFFAIADALGVDPRELVELVLAGYLRTRTKRRP